MFFKIKKKDETLSCLASTVCAVVFPLKLQKINKAIYRNIHVDDQERI